MRGGRRWRWLSCGPPCHNLGPEIGWVIIKWAEVIHPTSIFAQASRLASRPLACRPRKLCFSADAGGRSVHARAQSAAMRPAGCFMARVARRCRLVAKLARLGHCGAHLSLNSTRASLACHECVTPKLADRSCRAACVRAAGVRPWRAAIGDRWPGSLVRSLWRALVTRLRARGTPASRAIVPSCMRHVIAWRSSWSSHGMQGFACTRRFFSPVVLAPAARRSVIGGWGRSFGHCGAPSSLVTTLLARV